ncbi:MAG: type II toxin-antitoxin system RelE/ParE family toxin [Legionellales bacterium]|nr:type II toxin-antitoxin system RelE/ParE family toxin [Legionellales bacterium]
MKYYKVKKFAMESKRAEVSDHLLIETVTDFFTLDEKGQQRYSLGGGLYKLRIASKAGKGKSGGSRSILAFNQGDKVIWLHLFSKNEKDNITKSEFKKLKVLAEILLKLNEQGITHMIELGELYEVNHYV